MVASASRLFALSLAVVGSFTMATCGWADLTLHVHYKLVSGDTVTRANYYASKRMRATAPDGREYMYFSYEKRVAVIDHPAKLYWEGPMSMADSVVDSLNAMRYREIMSTVTEEQRAAWPGIVASINDSLMVRGTQDHREIAGVSCTRWVVTAGSWMTSERWIAPDLQVPNYTPSIQRILLTSIQQPLTQGLAKFLIGAVDSPGLPLAVSTTFRTMTTSGSYSWETFQVDTGRIPESAWQIPADYRRMQWSDRKKR